MYSIIRVLERYVDVPIVLPAVPRALFDAANSSVHLGSPAPQGLLAWRWKDGRRLLATYGTASLFNCGGGPPREVKIGKQAGLAVTSDRRSKVIWPAEPRFPNASYGLSGTWPLKRLLAWGAGMQQTITEKLKEAPLSGCASRNGALGDHDYI